VPLVEFTGSGSVTCEGMPYIAFPISQRAVALLPGAVASEPCPPSTPFPPHQHYFFTTTILTYPFPSLSRH
jgi:hypothetical protein